MNNDRLLDNGFVAVVAAAPRRRLGSEHGGGTPGTEAKRPLTKRDFCMEMRDDIHAILTAVKAGDLHHAEVLGEITIDQIDNVLAEN